MKHTKEPDAWLYEGETMVYKKDHRCLDLVEQGFVETPLFYKRAHMADPAAEIAKLREELKPTKIGHEGPRVETGPLQFGDDWPGVFIRGDNAMRYAMQITFALQHGIDADPLGRRYLEGLARLLASCDTRAEAAEIAEKNAENAKLREDLAEAVGALEYIANSNWRDKSRPKYLSRQTLAKIKEK